MNETKQPAAAEPERVHRAVWARVGFRHFALKAEDGELLAEVRGTHPPGVYEYQGKRYHGEQEAKDAAMRALGAREAWADAQLYRMQRTAEKRNGDDGATTS